MFANRVSSLDIYQSPFSAGNTGCFLLVAMPHRCQIPC